MILATPWPPAASQGQYFKRRGAEATVLSFVAPILEESADQLAPYKQASLKFAEEVAAAEAAAQAAEAAAGAAAANGGAAEEEERAQRGASPAPVGPQVGPAGPPQQPQQQGQQEGLVESEGDGSDGEGAGAAAGPIGPIGPAAFPPERGASEQPEGDEEEEDGDVAAGARRAGPAMPPAEWLAAAAQVLVGCWRVGGLWCCVVAAPPANAFLASMMAAPCASTKAAVLPPTCATT